MQNIPIILDGLTEYLSTCRAAMPQNAVFVCGHAAPDTDAAVSAIIEAYRRHLTDGEAAVPFIPAENLPAEIAYLLGDALSAQLLYTKDIAEVLSSPDTRYILTDHHDVNERRVIAIVDHHLPAEGVDFSGIDADIQPVGATTTLVAQRCREDGLIPDAAMARVLLGGILMDTEGLSPAKARPIDYTVAEWLCALWGGDADALFAELRGQLLAETDLPTLYRRDYRRFGDELGFAVIKIWESTLIDETSLRALLNDDREVSGVAATLAKISRYGQDGLKNETYFVSAPPALAHTLTDTVCRATEGCVSADTSDRIDLSSDAKRLSRKRLVPILLPLLKKP